MGTLLGLGLGLGLGVTAKVLAHDGDAEAIYSIRSNPGEVAVGADAEAPTRQPIMLKMGGVIGHSQALCSRRTGNPSPRA
jgi:hypothetical protein